MNRLDLSALSVILVLLFSTAGIAWIGSPVVLQVQAQGVSSGSQFEVGPLGPIHLQFSHPIQADRLAALLAIQPALPGRLVWNDPSQADYVPDAAVADGMTYTLTLDPGVLGKNGEKIAAAQTWTFKRRAPLVIYLTAQASSGDLWIADPSGSQPARQVTHTRGDIFDYAPAPNGEKIIYSVFNAKSGMDLWIVNRDGSQAHILLDCGSDRCMAASWAADSIRIAYSRQSAGITADAPLGAPRPWLMDTRTGETKALFDDPQVIGYGPFWSPDAKKIATFDGVQGGIRILDLDSKATAFLATQTGKMGNWSPDSRSMVYTDMTGADNHVEVLEGDVVSGQSQAIFQSAQLAANYLYDVPVFSPDGKWLAVGVQESAQAPTHHLWRVSTTGDQAQALTSGEGFIDDEYSWSPEGDRLLFRQLDLSAGGGSRTMLWNEATNEVISLAQDSTHPFWLP